MLGSSDIELNVHQYDYFKVQVERVMRVREGWRERGKSEGSKECKERGERKSGEREVR